MTGDYNFVNFYTGKTISGMELDSVLPYYTDWNWLKEAIYQYKMLYFGKRIHIDFDPSEWETYKHQYCWHIEVDDGGGNIEATADSLYSAICWYNSLKKNKKR